MFGLSSTASQPPKSLFGSQPVGGTGQQTGGLFGQQTTATSTAGQQSGSLFGQQSTGQQSGGLFGQTSTAGQHSGSLFGQQPASSTAQQPGSLFGQQPTSTASQPGGLFGQQPASTASQPGSLFGPKPTITTGGGLFGQSTTGTTGQSGSLFGNQQSTTSLFGQPSGTAGQTGSFFPNSNRNAFGQPQAAGAVSDDMKSLQTVILNSQAFTSAISDPKLYGDDRDAAIALFNQLLAAVGTGKGFYDKNKPPVEFDAQNPFYQFKAVGYCALSHYKNNDGIVGLIINEPATNYTTASQKQKLIDTLYSIMGSDVNLHAHFVDIRPTTDSTCEVDVYVTKREVGRINAKQVYHYFEQKEKSTALQQQLKVLRVIPKVEMDEAEIQKYLSHPPKGFTEVEWREAIVLNPEPKNLLPYPVYGFKELSERRQRQVIENEQQRKTFDALIARKKVVIQEVQEVDGLRKIFVQDAAKLKHRILRIVAAMYAHNTKNAIMSIEEEKLSARVDTVYACVNAPDKIRDNLEKLRNYFKSNKALLEESRKDFDNSHGLTEEEASGLKRYLNRRQQDLESLVKTLQANSEDIGVMVEHLR